MSEIKAGDTVRVVDASAWGETLEAEMLLGGVGTLHKVAEAGIYGIRLDGYRHSDDYRYWYNAARFEKVEATPKTFGELSAEEKGALLLAFHEGKVIEGSLSALNWRDTTVPAWIPQRYYRVKPEAPVVLPSIDWSHVAPEYTHLAVDQDGDAHLYMGEPYKKADYWYGGVVRWCGTSAFASYRRGTAPWDQSLVARPGIVGQSAPPSIPVPSDDAEIACQECGLTMGQSRRLATPEAKGAA